LFVTVAVKVIASPATPSAALIATDRSAGPLREGLSMPGCPLKATNARVLMARPTMFLWLKG
jgi:hypothetical protein